MNLTVNELISMLQNIVNRKPESGKLPVKMASYDSERDTFAEGNARSVVIFGDCIEISSFTTKNSNNEFN